MGGSSMAGPNLARSHQLPFRFVRVSQTDNPRAFLAGLQGTLWDCLLSIQKIVVSVDRCQDEYTAAHIATLSQKMT